MNWLRKKKWVLLFLLKLDKSIGEKHVLNKKQKLFRLIKRLKTKTCDIWYEK